MSKIKIIKIVLPIQIFTLVLAFFAFSPSVAAETRLEKCFNDGTSNQQIEDCVNQVNQEAWFTCAESPDPGPCAEEYKNAQVPSVSKEQITDTGGTGGVCGDETHGQVKTIINIGCRGEGNPIVDMLFSVIRVLSVGVGIVVVASVVVGGIQYTTAGGDPQKTAAAMKRIANAVGALVLYIFIFALLNWLVPGGVF